MRINSKGFTLIELLVVIAIVGLLSTMATVAARYAIDKAKIAKAQHAVDTIYSAIVMLGNDTNEWPGHQTPNEVNTTGNKEFCFEDATVPVAATCGVNRRLSDGAAGLIANDGTSPFNNWNGPYMNNIAPDPWGHEYFFDTNYCVNENNVGCGCGSVVNPHNVVVVGSFGPDGLGVDKLEAPYGDLTNSFNSSSNACDDVIKIIAFQN
jgi:prepilin-type N-terminal cleavage/methylation domain-containing protein